jgi:hypothetical protein
VHHEPAAYRKRSRSWPSHGGPNLDRRIPTSSGREY